MAYKILISGKNNLIIDDFFDHMEEFEVMTTSLRIKDIAKHLDKLEPDLFVYCLYNETSDDYKRIMEFKRRFTRQDVRLVVIGSVDDCDLFQKETNSMADLILTKPITAEMIVQQIKVFMAELERQREELRQIQEEMERRAEAARRKHVLVIDDDPLMLKVIKEYLHDDYDVATAISGKIAYKFLETKKTDLILLDYEMPNENGPQVLENIRNNFDVSNIPVLFLTGTTDREKIAQALMLKPQGYLLKPIDKEKLLGNIEKFFGDKYRPD